MKSHVLLTGASGLIGRNWLPSLLAADPERRVTALVRRPDLFQAPSGPVQVLRGDAKETRFGLKPDEWDTLRSSLTEVIHCAADIRFGLPINEARHVNLRGTEAVLDLARASPNLRRIAHVSTVYVMGKAEGELPEAPFEHNAGFVNSYQQSKYEAERVMIETARELPVTILRLGSVIGDSRSGRVEQFHHFHQLLKLAARNPLRMIPALAAGQVDFVSSDWAIQALSYLYERCCAPGLVFNVCAGPPHSMRVDEVIEEAFAPFGCAPPELVTTEIFERYAQAGDRSMQRLLAALSHFLPHLSLNQSFANQRTLALLKTAGVPFPDSRTLLRQVVEFCSAGVPIPAGEPVG